MAYDHDKWRAYENKRAAEVEAELTAALDAKDFERFKIIYAGKALRYLTKKRRNVLYYRFLELKKADMESPIIVEEVKNDTV